MKKYFLLLLIFTFIGCTDEDPFTGEENLNTIPEIGNAVFIQDNEIYYIEDLRNDVISKVEAPAGEKTDVRVNHAGTKIAYLNTDGTPIVIDRSGNIMETLSNFTNVKDYNWSADDQTIYMLIGNELKFHGNAMDVPSISLSPPGVPSNSMPRIFSLSISSENELMYVINKFDFTFGYGEVLIIKDKDGIKVNEAFINNFGTVSYCRYSTNDDISIAISEYGNNPDSDIDKVLVHEAGTFSLSTELEFNGNLIGPIYRSDISYMLHGGEKIRLRSFIDTDMFDYENDTFSPTSMDWK